MWIPVADGLRRRGWDVTTALEEDTLGYSDAEHLRYAIERDWTLLTFGDFLGLVETEFATVDHPGVVFVSQHGRTVGELVKRIDAALQRQDGRDVTGEIIYA